MTKIRHGVHYTIAPLKCNLIKVLEMSVKTFKIKEFTNWKEFSTSKHFLLKPPNDFKSTIYRICCDRELSKTTYCIVVIWPSKKASYNNHSSIRYYFPNNITPPTSIFDGLYVMNSLKRIILENAQTIQLINPKHTSYENQHSTTELFKQ